jgi:hypothetical protein
VKLYLLAFCSWCYFSSKWWIKNRYCHDSLDTTKKNYFGVLWIIPVFVLVPCSLLRIWRGKECFLLYDTICFHNNEAAQSFAEQINDLQRFKVPQSNFFSWCRANHDNIYFLFIICLTHKIEAISSLALNQFLKMCMPPKYTFVFNRYSKFITGFPI